MTQEKNVSSTSPKNRKSVKWLRFFLSIVVIIVLGYVVLNYVPFIAKYDHYVIGSGSMDPVIKKYDVVIIDTSTNPEDLVEGQIIAFNVDINDDGIEDVVVHYIYSINNDGENTTYKTTSEMGTVDGWTLTDDDILGSHVLTIKSIGKILLFTQSTIGKIVIVVDIIVIYILVDYLAKPKKKKEIEEEIIEQKE